jgi:outer membrane receptor protein involved in Fe transport
MFLAKHSLTTTFVIMRDAKAAASWKQNHVNMRGKTMEYTIGNRFASTWVPAIAIGLCSAQLTQAQQPNSDTTVLETIVITALKRATTLEDTPLPVSVMSGDYLKGAGVVDLRDLQQIAPSVNMDSSPFGVNINIRGVTTTDNTSKGDQGVGFTVDGITIGRPREMVVAFLDVDRVEVLRGPQGTLYGKSTTGGVINVISKRPEFTEFSGNASLEVGNYSTQRMTGAFNIPLTDNFAVRVAAQTNKREGYWKANLGNYSTTARARADEDNSSYRLSALWNINDNHSIFVTGTKTEVRGVGGGGIPSATFFSGGRSVYAVPDGIAPGVNEDFDNLTLEYTGVFGGIEAHYLGGVRSYTADTFTAGTTSPAFNNIWGWGNYTGTGDTTSHEVRFSNANSGRFNWVVGYNNFKEELTESDHNWNSPIADTNRANALNAFDAANATDHTSSGVFGQVDWGVTDRLNLTAGVRRSKDSVVRKGALGFGSGAPPVSPANCHFPSPCTFIPNDANQEASKTTWRLGFDLDVGDKGMIYGFAATGYKAGGFNDIDPNNAPNSGVYEPEELIDYEVGYKGNITDTLIWNTSVFYYDYKKLQLSNVEPVIQNPDGTFSSILFSVSVPAEIKGWENELIWTPTDNDRVLLNFTTLDGKFKKYTDYPAYLANTSFVKLAGDPINKVSDFTLSIDWSHEFNLANGAALTARIYSRYDGGYPLNNYYNKFYYKVDSFTRSDANITYRSADKKFSVGAFVKNIEDDLQVQGTPGSPNGAQVAAGFNQYNTPYSTVNVNDPRTFGVRLSVNF